jgi:hypothetical protein
MATAVSDALLNCTSHGMPLRRSLAIVLPRRQMRSGEGADSTDTTPGQCLHPVGHWYEALVDVLPVS